MGGGGGGERSSVFCVIIDEGWQVLRRYWRGFVWTSSAFRGGVFPACSVPHPSEAVFVVCEPHVVPCPSYELGRLKYGQGLSLFDLEGGV